MMTPPLRIVALVGAFGLLAGCTSPLPVVPQAIRCDVDPALLAGKCAAPSPIPADATFGGLVGAMQNDRQALRECALSAEALRASIGRCNAATDEFNKKVDEINEKLRTSAR